MDIFGRKRMKATIVAQMNREREDALKRYRNTLRKCLAHLECCYSDDDVRPQCLADGISLLEGRNYP